jgi:ATP-dependent Clp protease ATP-binding subunit ClpA
LHEHVNKRNYEKLKGNMAQEENNGRINEVIAKAFQEALSREHEYVTLEHILRVMLDEEEIKDVLTELQVDVIALRDEIDNWLREQEDIRVEGVTKPRKTATLERCFNRAYTQAIFTGRGHMEPLDLLISISSEKNSHANFFLVKNGVTKDAIIGYVGRLKDGRSKESKGAKKRDSEKILAKYTTNLNKAAEKQLIDPLIGREKEVFRLAQTLTRKKKNNAIMVGEPGVGKTAIVEGLAVAIIRNEVPEVLKGKTVYSLDLGKLMAGTRYRGDFEERMQHVLEALEERDDAILFIDEIHMIMGAGAGGQGSMDVANLLKPALEKGKLRCVGSTTYEEFRENFEKDRALLRRFTKIDIEEMSVEDTKVMLRRVGPVYAKFHKLALNEEAIDLAIDLSMKYMLDKKLPDKAIDIIDSAMARLRVTNAEADTEVTKDHIRQEISDLTRVPLDQLGEQKNVAVADLESRMRTNVFGQDEAIERLMNMVYIAKSGLKEVNRPMANFLFVGPTGTGKTELANQLAEGLGMEMIRFDMSEYKEPHKIASLIGSPPGYVGYGEGKAGSGKLINELERTPNCVLLFDEIEKAHPDVIQVLLGLMDNGIVTGSDNKQASARNAFVILTSNLGAADSEKNVIGFGGGFNEAASDEAVKRFFSPEFRNRLDATVRFNRLHKDVIRRVADKFMTQIREQLREQNQTIIIEDSALDYLAEHGYSETMGARPMKRLINEQIRLPIAKRIIKEGLNVHHISGATNELVVS